MHYKVTSISGFKPVSTQNGPRKPWLGLYVNYFEPIWRDLKWMRYCYYTIYHEQCDKQLQWNLCFLSINVMPWLCFNYSIIDEVTATNLITWNYKHSNQNCTTACNE